MRQFEGLSDFFLNATEEEKREVYSEVIEKANQEQLKVVEKAKEIQRDKATTRETTSHVDAGFEQCRQTLQENL